MIILVIVHLVVLTHPQIALTPVKAMASDYDNPARKKQNKKKPVIGFRCPSPAFKRKVQVKADEAGLSVNEWLLIAVSSYMAHPQEASAPAPATKGKKPKKEGGYLKEFIDKKDAEVEELNEALDALNFGLKD